MRRSGWLSASTGGDVYLKLETLQPTFSYKVRGALNAVLRLAESGQSPADLVTASAGNHGSALAHAAAIAGLPLTVYVPEHAPEVKLDALRRSGAHLTTCRDYDDAERRAKEHAGTGAATFISPYSHPDVIAGAGTIGLEILEDVRDIDSIVVAVGGGGLISGVAVAAGPDVQTYGVEAEASCPFARSLAAGRIVAIDVGPTLADGLAGNLDPDAITFDLVRRYAAGMTTVTEAGIRSAIRNLVFQERLVAEGAAAAAVAAVADGRIDLSGRRTAIVLSGANIDPQTLAAILIDRTC
jgi:threonine dehydratase